MNLSGVSFSEAKLMGGNQVLLFYYRLQSLKMQTFPEFRNDRQ
jgi:hypothetical protein